MKFTCNKANLDHVVSIVQKAVKSNSTVRILEGIYIEAVDNKVKLVGYDLATGIEAEIPADVMREGTVVINSKIFGDIIRKLPDDMISITSDSMNNVVIESGSACFNIKGLGSEEYPKIPTIENNNKIILPQAILKKMISSTIFAVSKDEHRQNLNGCYFECDGSNITLVAVDGFRMAIRTSHVGSEYPIMSFIVPGKSLNEAAKIFDDKNDDDEVILYTSNNHILFDIGNVKIVSRLITEEFIAYKSIIAHNPQSVVTINKQLMLDAIERASIVISAESGDHRASVDISMNNDQMITIEAITEHGNSKESIPAKISGNNIDISFNSRFFIDVLKNVEDEQICIEFNGSVGPCFIKPLDGEVYTYMLLPLRRNS